MALVFQESFIMFGYSAWMLGVGAGFLINLKRIERKSAYAYWL